MCIRVFSQDSPLISNHSAKLGSNPVNMAVVHSKLNLAMTETRRTSIMKINSVLGKYGTIHQIQPHAVAGQYSNMNTLCTTHLAAFLDQPASQNQSFYTLK